MENILNMALEDYKQLLRDSYYKVEKHTGEFDVDHQVGQKYIKIVVTNYGHRRVHSFIDKATGNILMAASWKAPAPKHPRGNILREEWQGVNWAGVPYLRA